MKKGTLIALVIGLLGLAMLITGYNQYPKSVDWSSNDTTTVDAIIDTGLVSIHNVDAAIDTAVYLDSLLNEDTIDTAKVTPLPAESGYVPVLPPQPRKKG